MDIQSVSIGEHLFGGFENEIVHPDINIVKSLRLLSVVESVHGSYRISLDNGIKYDTGEGGLFIAPSNQIQHINEFPGTDGRMTAQWAFIDVEINKMYKLDELFTFPVLMPEKYSIKAGELITEARKAQSISARLPCLAGLVGILLEIASPRKIRSEAAEKLRVFMNENYSREILPEEICEILNCSRSAMYPKFRDIMGDSPSRYINSLRIRNSQYLLINTDLSMAKIASMVGIDDQYYFSRLFRSITGTSASEYRKFNRSRGDQGDDIFGKR